MFFRPSKTLMGLDIGSSAVKAIELKASGKGYPVTAIGVEPIPPDSIVDGAIIDGGAVADAVRRLFANTQFKAKEVAASLSGNSVIVKKITPPAMTEQELAESIYWEAELTTTDYDYVTISDSAYPDFVHQDVRPSVDVNDGNWTTHDPPSSSNLAAQIDETTIDKTDYIQSQAF